MAEPTRDPIRPWFVLLCMALSAFIAWGIQEHRHAKQLQAIQETVEARFEKIGKATQAQGHVVDAQQLAFRVKEILAPELAREISRQGGRIVSTVAATGSVPATVLPLQPVAGVVNPETEGVDITVKQDRGGLPPLTWANIAYHPQHGFSVGWQNRAENFRLGFAQWRTGGDGLRAAARLSREVDGQAEEIPLTAADAYFPASEIQRLAPVPKWSAGAGLGRDSRGRLQLNAIYERHFDRHWSVQVGHVNGGPSVITKYTWGFK